MPADMPAVAMPAVVPAIQDFRNKQKNARLCKHTKRIRRATCLLGNGRSGGGVWEWVFFIIISLRALSRHYYQI